jgi:hypothetical protein
MARTEFDLAADLKPRKVSDFASVEEIRDHLISSIKQFRHRRQLGVISDFQRKSFDLQSDFVRIGGGSIGGKGRGLAFINAILIRYKLEKRFDKIDIRVPFSAIVGTDVFDQFLEINDLRQFALGDHSDDELVAAFKAAALPDDIRADLEALLTVVDYPIAVRSSSMLEDSHVQPFAGVYDTHMLPNNHDELSVRLNQLEQSIKVVYASTFSKQTRMFHEMSGNRLEDEKMAVIIQQAVGSPHGDAFYPHVSGVGMSYNYYTIDDVKPEEGVVYLALGMGKTIVDGMTCLRFSPARPEKLPQMSTVKDTLKNAQREFFAIDLSDSEMEPTAGGDSGLIKLDLGRAIDDNSIADIASVYSPQNERIYDGLSRQGAPLITFAPILKYDRFPLAKIVKSLLRLGSMGLNCPIEIEFAVNLDRDKKDHRGFYFLQIRPMAKENQFEMIDIDAVDKERTILYSNQALGNMRIETIHDIICVPPDTFDRGKTVEIAQQVGLINARLQEEGRPYVLIGPGRWGTSERWLGVPVTWDQIHNAAVIVEVATEDFSVDPSFGTHFFANLTAFHIGYITINEPAGNGCVDWNWMLAQNVVEQTEFVRHIKLSQPLEILIDGRQGNAAIIRPEKFW